MVQKIPASGLESVGGNFKNLLVNGDYQIWQRATSAATVTASNSAGTYMSDRWASWEYNDGTITQEQSALDNDDFETTGMRNALLVKCTGTDSSIAADQFAMITQVIEAQNCQGLKWGTDNAKDVTLSFWVKSNLTGTFTATLRKPDSTYYYIPKEYTISSANTWEKKRITYGPDDTNGSVLKASTGNIVNDNGEGIWVQFGLAFGSNFHGTAGTWANALTGISTSNQTNFMSSTSNNFYLTGVQFEAGSGASDFEHLPHDVQLRRCKRYFQTLGMASNSMITGSASATTNTHLNFQHPDGEMRTSPTVTLPTAGNSSGTTAFLTAPGAYPSTIGSHAASVVTEHLVRVDGTSYSANFVAGYASLFYSNGPNTFKMDAEL